MTNEIDQLNIGELIGRPWLRYYLSPDGTELVIDTEPAELRFGGIAAMTIATSSDGQQQDDDKEIDDFVAYRLKDHTVSVREFYGGDGYGDNRAVAIGPLWLRVVFGGDRKFVLKKKGFFFSGTYFSVTLICCDFVLIPKTTGTIGMAEVS